MKDRHTDTHTSRFPNLSCAGQPLDGSVGGGGAGIRGGRGLKAGNTGGQWDLASNVPFGVGPRLWSRHTST